MKLEKIPMTELDFENWDYSYYVRYGKKGPLNRMIFNTEIRASYLKDAEFYRLHKEAVE